MTTSNVVISAQTRRTAVSYLLSAESRVLQMIDECGSLADGQKAFGRTKAELLAELGMSLQQIEGAIKELSIRPRETP